MILTSDVMKLVKIGIHRMRTLCHSSNANRGIYFISRNVMHW